jgi:glycosyltransferase involved in cell wall biosynthesis
MVPANVAECGGNQDRVLATAPTSGVAGTVKRLDLSVVVIGRNEEAHLGPALDSLEAIPLACEVIYVDSDSADQSVGVALRHGARVASLAPSAHLCAAAGRYVGTLLARSPWILYLDGDMQLEPEFARQIPECLRAAETAPEIGGFVGLYRNVHEDGTVRENLLRQRLDRATADTFGGAVLASREAVLRAGNWDFHVSAYEELDLHSRLHASGHVVRFVPLDMIVHRTATPSPLSTLLSLFLPFGRRNRRALGIGQLIRSRLRSRSLARFVGFYPYPFTYLLLVAAGIAVAALPFRGALAGLALPFAGAIYVARSRGVPSVVVYLSFPLRIVLGAISHPSRWEPSFEIMDASSGTAGAART